MDLALFQLIAAWLLLVGGFVATTTFSSRIKGYFILCNLIGVGMLVVTSIL